MRHEMGLATEGIVVDQALHGYSDGHRLVAASLKLRADVERIMLTMSDMSGPSMVGGFRSYFTGYALKNTGMYALGKTWYAPEMDRPGCVWTHTLLFKTDFFARIQDLESLLSLFRRPSRNQWSSYRSKFTVPLTTSTSFFPNEHRFPSLVAKQTLSALYSSPEKPVYIVAEESTEYERLVFVLWTQQWQSLRSSFYFCTGSLADRKINSKSLDLQIIPRRRLAQFRREVPDGVFVGEHGARTSELPSWVTMIYADLSAPGGTEMRKFLEEFGPHLPGERSAFPHLAKFHLLGEEVRRKSVPLSKLIEAVSIYFPGKQEAVGFKVALFGPERGIHSVLPCEEEENLLLGLSTTPHYSAFRASDLSISQRGKHLVNSEFEKATHLVYQLVRSDLNPLGEQCLKGICNALTGKNAIELSSYDSSLLQVLVKHNPNLATSAEVWRSLAAQQQEMFDIIADLELTEDVRKRVVTAILDAECNATAERVESRFGEESVKWILGWLDSSRPCAEIDEEWRRVLRRYPTAIVGWMNSAPVHQVSTLALVAGLLDPHSPPVTTLGAEVWLPLALKGPNELEKRMLVKSMTFLLALGFNNPGPRAPELVASAFQIVHDAAASGELSYEVWSLIKDQVPSLTWWREWDKCERMRRALVERFIRYRWPIELFLQAVKSEDTFEKITDFSQSNAAARAFVRSIAEQVFRGQVDVTSSQREALATLRTMETDELL